MPVTRELGENEALFSNRKIREVLGFREEHDWRQYVHGLSRGRTGEWITFRLRGDSAWLGIGVDYRD